MTLIFSHQVWVAIKGKKKKKRRHVMLVTDRLLQDDMLLPRYLMLCAAVTFLPHENRGRSESSVSFNPFFCTLSPLHLLPNVAKQKPVLHEVRSEGFQTHPNPLFQSLHVPCSLALP